MGWAYSVDLRERVVVALDVGMTDKEAAVLFRIGEATVRPVGSRLRRETRALVRRPGGGGNRHASRPISTS